MPQPTIDDIQYLIYEEKLARDVYQFISAKYEMQVFTHKIQAEENHRLLLLGLLDTSVSMIEEYGKFPSDEWTQLFQSLQSDAAVSVENALLTGARIEELDIYDLEKRRALTTDSSILHIYDVLISASEQHLRSFLSQLQARNLTFTPQYLSKERIDLIKNASSGCGHENQSCPSKGGTGGC